MRRIATANRSVDMFGAGKDGFRSSVPGVSDATYLSASWMNSVQESILRVIENAGMVPNDDYEQLNKALISMTNQTINNRVFDSIDLLRANTNRDFLNCDVTSYYGTTIPLVAPPPNQGKYYKKVSDKTSIDNGCDCIVDLVGQRWYLQKQGRVSVTQAGAWLDGAHIDTVAIQKCINLCRSIWIPDGVAMIDQDLVVPDNVRIEFSENAIFRAAKDGLTFFRSDSHAYFSSIHNPRLDGAGHIKVVGFDMINFRLNSGIFNAFLMLMDTGFVGREGCFGTLIDNPTMYGVKFPIVFIRNNSSTIINNPNFDNSVVAGGDGKGAGITIQYGAGSNLGARVNGGYIQGFDLGIDDGAIGTIISETYFEACTLADITANTTAIGGKYLNCGHWGHIGAAAYRFRNTDSMTIWNPTMGSGARTVLYDIDGTNTNCVEYRPDSNSNFNQPLGNTDFIKSIATQSKLRFSPTAAGSVTVGDATYTVQTAVVTKTGSSVSFQLSLTWVGHTGSGALIIKGMPSQFLPNLSNQKVRLSVSPGFPFTGPIVNAVFIGSGTDIGVRQISTAGSESLLSLPASGSIDIYGVYST
ncbi:hypothetical protein ACO0K0_07075 [Undibacterium sp. SXout11W]|uniref:hypothetical protein n=1 Tax=Undibacterium sp. SXout11W TaxID=3413050 RepID=UPI003BEFDC54